MRILALALACLVACDSSARPTRLPGENARNYLTMPIHVVLVETDKHASPEALALLSRRISEQGAGPPTVERRSVVVTDTSWTTAELLTLEAAQNASGNDLVILYLPGSFPGASAVSFSPRGIAVFPDHARNEGAALVHEWGHLCGLVKTPRATPGNHDTDTKCCMYAISAVAGDDFCEFCKSDLAATRLTGTLH